MSAPAWASPTAIACPKPCPAPVTKATCPSNRIEGNVIFAPARPSNQIRRQNNVFEKTKRQANIVDAVALFFILLCSAVESYATESIHQESAVHVQHCAGNKTRFVRREKQCCSGDVIHSRESSERNGLFHFFHYLARPTPRHLGFGRHRRNCVHCNAERRVTARETFGQTQQPCFRRRVMRADGDTAHLARDR